MKNLGPWSYRCDSEATREAYQRIKIGGVEACGCKTCRNFAAVRDVVYPDRFVEFLKSLGVELSKEAEVYWAFQASPGQHQYCGWFHFVGALENTFDGHELFAPGFKVWLTEASAPSLESLKGYSLVQVEFCAENVPWVLDEPEEK